MRSLPFIAPRRRARRASVVALLVGLGALLSSTQASAQSCPAGQYCYYVPPILNAPPVSPDNYGGDIVLSSPTGTITGTYRKNGGAAEPFSVAAGTPVFISLGPTEGQISGFLVAEARGTFIVASSSALTVDQRVTALYWQSSSSVKSNVVGLGKRFRAGAYTLNSANGDGTGYDFLSFYAPTAATIVVTAPPGAAAPFWNDGINGLAHTFTLQAGQTYMMRSQTGADIDGALITSDQPVSVASGGRGWVLGTCGDDGMDHLVPTDLLGTQFIVDDYPSTLAESVRVVTDNDATDVFVNGALAATINAGQTYAPSISGVTFLETSTPSYVYQNAGLSLCELDVGLIPPVSFASLASTTISFDVIGNGAVDVMIPTAAVGTITLDGAPAPNPQVVAVPTHPEYSRVRFNISGGTHAIAAQSDFQLGMVSSNGGSGLFAYFNPYRLPGCGDATVGASEGCDDGNVDDGDGCSAVCQVEPYYGCMGSGPSVCSPLDTDSDGMSDLDEAKLGYDPSQADADMDGILDPNDLDLDNDGIPNVIECDSASLSLVNGSFEEPKVNPNTVNYFTEDLVPGWDTSASDDVMEFWGTGFLGVPAADGGQFVELNANEVSTLYQDVTTTPGTVYLYRFYHRGRSGPETMTFYVGAPGAPVKIRDVTTDTSAWQLVTGTYTVPAGQTMTRFSFESLTGGSTGNFLDGISFTPACSTDTDSDGILDFRDTDSDNDTLPDGVEAGHGLAAQDGVVPGPYGSNGLADGVETAGDSGSINYTVVDTNTDGIYNFRQVDSDGDGSADNIDPFPLDPTEDTDTDGDGTGDNADNCAMTPNGDQADADGDGTGDVCEADTDMDGVVDDADNCVDAKNADQADADGDGIGDVCDADRDGDGASNDADNCPDAPNADQADTDKDGSGDACDPAPPEAGWEVTGSGCSCVQAGAAPESSSGLFALGAAALLAVRARRRR